MLSLLFILICILGCEVSYILHSSAFLPKREVTKRLLSINISFQMDCVIDPLLKASSFVVQLRRIKKEKTRDNKLILMSLEE